MYIAGFCYVLPYIVGFSFVLWLGDTHERSAECLPKYIHVHVYKSDTVHMACPSGRHLHGVFGQCEPVVLTCPSGRHVHGVFGQCEPVALAGGRHTLL